MSSSRAKGLRDRSYLHILFIAQVSILLHTSWSFVFNMCEDFAVLYTNSSVGVFEANKKPIEHIPDWLWIMKIVYINTKPLHMVETPILKGGIVWLYHNIGV